MNELKKFDIASSVTDSLIELFDMMLSMHLELADNDACQDLEGERIVVSVSLAGKVTGSITIHISDEFSRIMTAAMLGVEPEEVREAEDVKDVISEICNIVGGSLKSNFCDKGLACELSPPSFTTGNDFIIESLNTDRYEYYNFSYKQHHILVEVGVRINNADDASDQKKPSPEIQHEPVDINDIKDFDIKTYFVKSLIELFDTMLSMGLEQSEKDLKSTLDGKRIVGSVNLIGPLMGSVNIHVSENFARQMTASMLGMETDEVEGEDEIKDVIGEICNIVGGNLKSKFCDAGMFCELSTPSFTHGTNFLIEAQNIVRYEHFSFFHQQDTVFLEVILKVNADSQPDQAETSKEVITDKQNMGMGDPQEIIDSVIASETQKEETQKAIKTPVEKEPIGDSTERSTTTFFEKKEPKAEDKSKGSNDPLGTDIKTKNLDLVLDIPVDITVELGHAEKKISELLELGQGSCIGLSRLQEESVDILVNGTLVAKGEVVIEKEKYGVRVTETISRMQRIKSIK